MVPPVFSRSRYTLQRRDPAGNVSRRRHRRRQQHQPERERESRPPPPSPQPPSPFTHVAFSPGVY